MQNLVLFFSAFPWKQGRQGARACLILIPSDILYTRGTLSAACARALMSFRFLRVVGALHAGSAGVSWSTRVGQRVGVLLASLANRLRFMCEGIKGKGFVSLNSIRNFSFVIV